MSNNEAIHIFKPLIVLEAMEEVQKTLQSGWIGLGPKTELFEQEFAKYIGTNYCIGMNSGTSALHLALKCLELKPGTEVITTANTFISTNHIILYEGLKPVFADIKIKTGNIDPEDIVRKITRNTGAIIIVHYAGYPCDLDEIYKIARNYNIPIIEDCAHSTGAMYNGRKVGSECLLSCFSFHAVKNLPMGEGGAICTSNRYFQERLMKLRWMGINKSTYNRTQSQRGLNEYKWKYNVDEIGYKYHLNDIHASIGIEQLKYLDEHNAHRKEMAEMYAAKLVGKIQFMEYPAYIPDSKHSSYHFYPILVEDRDNLMSYLKSHNIHLGVHYMRNDNYPMYEKFCLMNTQIFTEKEISLPTHLYMDEEKIERVCNTINQFHEK